MSENIQQSTSRDMEAEYDNSGRVENAIQLINNYITDAEEYCSKMVENIDFGQSYGTGKRNRLDLFWPGKDRDVPIAMFIHGGYWQKLDRAAFSHMAKGLNAHGIAVAIPSYTLCPETNISGIIDEIRLACIILWKTYNRSISVYGHSAGGHLAACMVATNWNRIHETLPQQLVSSAIAVSGVFELAPLIETSLNKALKLTPKEARTASPSNWMIDPGQRFDAWVGADESSEFLRQSRSQAQRWRMLGADTRYQEIAGANHFTAVDQLTDPDSAMVKRLLELMQPASKPTIESLNISEFKPKPVIGEPVIDKPAAKEPEENRIIAEAPQEEVEPDTEKSAAPDKSQPEEQEQDINQNPEEATLPPEDEAEAQSDVKPAKEPVSDEGESEIESPSEKEAISKQDESDGSVLPAQDNDTAKSDAPTDEPENIAAADSAEQPVESEEKSQSESAPAIKEDATSTPRPPVTEHDDLTVISGINKKLQQGLQDLGISTFEQLSELTDTQIENIEGVLDIEGHIEQEHWISQARHQQAMKTLPASSE